jgi:hypothetical protein
MGLHSPRSPRTSLDLRCDATAMNPAGRGSPRSARSRAPGSTQATAAKPVRKALAAARIGLLGIGVAQILGIALRLAAVSSVVLMGLMWTGMWPTPGRTTRSSMTTSSTRCSSSARDGTRRRHAGAGASVGRPASREAAPVVAQGVHNGAARTPAPSVFAPLSDEAPDASRSTPKGRRSDDLS